MTKFRKRLKSLTTFIEKVQVAEKVLEKGSIMVKTIQNLPAMARYSTIFRPEEDIAGVEITDRWVIAARMARNAAGNLELTHLGRQEHPGLHDEEGVVEALKQVWQTYGIPTSTVAVCLHSPRLLIRRFRYDNVEREELDSTLSLQAEELMQLPREQLLVDWQVERAETAGSALEGLLVAIPQQEAEKHLALLRKANLYPIILDVSCTALNNLFRAVQGDEAPSETICLVHGSLSRISLAIVKTSSSFIYPRYRDCHAQQAELEPDFFVQYIQEALSYYEQKHPGAAVDRLALSGELSTNRDFSAAIKAQSTLPVVNWNPLEWPDIAFSPAIFSLSKLEEIGPQSAVALGLAMRADHHEPF